MKILLIIFTALLSLEAQATVTVSTFSGASNTYEVEANETLEIMAGISGSYKCSGQTNVLNTCELMANRAACNLKTTCPTTTLAISMVSDNTSGRVVLVDSANNTLIHKYNVDYVAGQNLSETVAWSKICPGITGAACNAGTGTKTLRLGVDSDNDDIPNDYITIKFTVAAMPNTIDLPPADPESIADTTDGIADYYFKPGDEKVILKEIIPVADYEVEEAAPITGLVTYFTPGNCAAAAGAPFYVNNWSDSVVLPIDEDDKDNVENRISEGLSNDIQYVFMVGFEDKAGNRGLFKDLTANCDDMSTGFTYNRHSAMPQAVYGLLEENQNCYITTAAYGSPLHAKVKTFKKFRDQILNQFSMGRKIINFYYRTSPPIAEKIQHNKFLKIATQAVLWPAWAISASVLYMGLMPFLFVVTMTLLSFVFLRQKKTKKSKQHLAVFLFVFMSLSVSQKSFAQSEDFFSTETSTKSESAPNEPPYNGTENDEFSDLEKSSQDSIEAETEYEPEIEAPQKSRRVDDGPQGNPDKWKPFRRVPDEKRLDELSKDGLMKITKKGEYHYDVAPSSQESAASFRFGMASFPDLQNPTNAKYFTDVYGEDKKPVLMVDYEWQFFQSFGKLGIKVGSGLMLASGKGQFATPIQTPDGPTTDADEKYTFFMFPNSLSAIYRLDIFNKQWIVPFAEAGVDYFGFIESRDDGDDIKFGGSPHFHFAVGGSFLLDTLGRDMMTEIDKQYGVNHMWLTAEYRRIESMGGDFDFSDDLINGGIMVEF